MSNCRCQWVVTCFPVSTPWICSIQQTSHLSWGVVLHEFSCGGVLSKCSLGYTAVYRRVWCMYLYVLHALTFASHQLSSLFESLVCAKRRISCLCCLFETLLCMLFVLRSGLSKRVYKSIFLVNCCLHMPPSWAPQRAVYIYPTNCNTYYTYLSNSTVSTGVDEQGVAVSKLFKTLGPPCHCRALLKDALVHDEGACNQLVFSFNQDDIWWTSNSRTAGLFGSWKVTWLLISLLKLAVSSFNSCKLGSKLVQAWLEACQRCRCCCRSSESCRWHT